jgi:hypothetical protein
MKFFGSRYCEVVRYAASAALARQAASNLGAMQVRGLAASQEKSHTAAIGVLRSLTSPWNR